jgi:16S rRNA (adenine1518-N6/adenine1519-N6)-dimethyltransferase
MEFGLVPNRDMTQLLKRTLRDLEKLGIRPAKGLGQNFLVDENVIHKFLSISGVRNGDTVVEIGAGLGTISEKILAVDAQLFAIEIDGRLHSFLKERFMHRRNFHVQRADAVEFPTAQLPASTANFKVIANLPYAIASPWLGALLNCQNLPQSLSLIVQTEAAQRFLAPEGSSKVCPVAIFLQSAYDLVCSHKISSTAFYPAPEVSSTMIFMDRRRDVFVFKTVTKGVIRSIFTKRRKQIGGIVGRHVATEDERTALREWMRTGEVSPLERPEKISMDRWRRLDNFF